MREPRAAAFHRVARRCHPGLGRYPRPHDLAPTLHLSATYPAELNGRSATPPQDTVSTLVCYDKKRSDCAEVHRTDFNFMGYSIRTAGWRCTAWFPWKNMTLTADFNEPYAEELYNHTGDASYEMDMHENSNVATSSPAVAKALHSKLVSFFTDHARDRDKSISLAAGALQTDAPARQQAGAGTGHPPSVPQTTAHTVLG